MPISRMSPGRSRQVPAKSGTTGKRGNHQLTETIANFGGPFAASESALVSYVGNTSRTKPGHKRRPPCAHKIFSLSHLMRYLILSQQMATGVRPSEGSTLKAPGQGL